MNKEGKWPNTLTLIRHDVSDYNRMKELRHQDPLYQKFLDDFHKDPFSANTRQLAQQVADKWAIDYGNYNTPLHPEFNYASQMAKRLKEMSLLPDIVYISTYQRTHETFDRMCQSWPELKSVPYKSEERIREQDMGLLLIYNDRRVLFALHPEQLHLYRLEGPYWYRYPQGENVPDVRLRGHSWQDTLIREHAGQNVLAVTHHLTILSLRANFERLSPEQFLELDHSQKPINCGVTIYRQDPALGKQGKLILTDYNLRLY